MNNIDSVIKQIAAACGIEEKNVIVNDLYLQWVLQPSYETIAVCGILILAIVLFSVVVIYNIFQVGIANKIQEYGKIKALGATKKQMKQLIFRAVSYTHLDVYKRQILKNSILGVKNKLKRHLF